MRIIAIPLSDGRRAYYSEGPTPEELAGAGWLTRKLSGMRTGLNRKEGGLGPWMARMMTRLERLAPADEPILRDLRPALAIEMLHPPGDDPKEVRRAWRRYLKHRRPPQLWWMLLNGLIAPFTLLLAVLPGPNVIGYWFGYRAICRLLAFLGIRRALDKQFPFATHPAPALENAAPEAIADELGLDTQALIDFLGRMDKAKPVQADRRA